MGPAGERVSAAPGQPGPAERQVRTLVVSDEPGWPPDSGYRQRLHHLLRGMGEAGPVHVLTVGYSESSVPPPPPALVDQARLEQARVVSAPRMPLALAALRWAAGVGPRSVVLRDWSAARAALAALSPHAYDVVWFEHPEVWAALSDLLPGTPHVLDMDNIMSVLLTRAAATVGPVEALQDLWDIWQWRRLERRAVASDTVVVVCSERDRGRLGPRSVVIPNGYEQPSDAPARAPGSSPVLTMVGSLRYPPNADGAQWFAEQVLPRIRDAVPQVCVRFVGETMYPPEQHPLGRHPGVEVAGFVPDVLAELATCTAAVVPLRVGGGTRIKVLEAFASGVPVVSTSVGCEGIRARPGRDLLVEDDADAFADACILLLRDPVAADRLARAGRAVHERGYQWQSIRPQVAAVLQQLARARA